jgi:hypothetical protein
VTGTILASPNAWDWCVTGTILASPNAWDSQWHKDSPMSCHWCVTGTILASAAGVVVSSASNVSISHNNISDCSRWGIAVRSNGGAGSWNNTIGPGNRVLRTGLTTSDFGAISLIDHTSTHNVSGNRIIGNCVRDTRGMRDTMWRGIFGQVLTHFWGRSVYLDDHTSFTEISGNVFIDSSVYHSALVSHAFFLLTQAVVCTHHATLMCDC